MLTRLTNAAIEVALLAMVFAAVAICVHGLRRHRLSEQVVRDWRINLSFMLFEVVVMAPLLVVVSSTVKSGLGSFGFAGPLTPVIDSAPFWVQLTAVCLLIDFIGYWRHRFMHTRPMWPVHSVHHSDLTVTWLTLVRFHPLNRVITVLLVSAGMALVGFPESAIVWGVIVVHFYGYLLHADIPWKYGALKYVFVSPTMHRWHHSYAEDVKDKNFASLFAFYDVWFGTFALPDRAVDLIGVGDDSYPQTWLGQIIHPFRVWLGPLTPKPLTRDPASSHRA